MPVCLSLIIPYFLAHDSPSFCVLRAGDDPGLLAAVRTLSEQKGRHVVRGGISTYMGRDPSGKFEGVCYGKTEYDAYGDIMLSVCAADLLMAVPVAQLEGWEEKATMAYVAAMPPEWPIYLYWH